MTKVKSVAVVGYHILNLLVPYSGFIAENLSTSLEERKHELDQKNESIKEKDDKIRELTESFHAQNDKLSQMEQKVQHWMQKAESKPRNRESVENAHTLRVCVTQLEQTILSQGEKVRKQEETIKSQGEKVRRQEESLADKDKANYKLQQVRDRLDQNLLKTTKEKER